MPYLPTFVGHGAFSVTLRAVHLRPTLLFTLFAACSGASMSPAPSDSGVREVSVDVSADAPLDDDAGATAAVTLDYAQVDCAAVEAVAFNGGGIRQNEICDRGRLTASRYATVRACAESLTDDAALVRRIADEGAYMNPTRHPGATRPPCSRFTVLYPVEQVQRAIWCLRHPGRCADDGSAL